MEAGLNFTSVKWGEKKITVHTKKITVDYKFIDLKVEIIMRLGPVNIILHLI